MCSLMWSTSPALKWLRTVLRRKLVSYDARSSGTVADSLLRLRQFHYVAVYLVTTAEICCLHDCQRLVMKVVAWRWSMHRVRYLIVRCAVRYCAAVRVLRGVNERPWRTAGRTIRNASTCERAVWHGCVIRDVFVSWLRGTRRSGLENVVRWLTHDPSFCNYPVTHARPMQFPLAWSRSVVWISVLG